MTKDPLPPRGVDLDGALILLPSTEWDNFTEEDGPYTVARDVPGAVGVLQFSVGWYRSGPEPRPTDEALRALVVDWGQRSGDLELVTSLPAWTSGPVRWVAGTYRDERQQPSGEPARCWRVFYGSDGRNFVMATYNCPWEHRDREQADVDAIIQSFRFRPQDEGLVPAPSPVAA